MGQLNVAEMNPVTVVANGIKSVCHDLSVYVCNACKSECNFLRLLDVRLPDL